MHCTDTKAHDITYLLEALSLAKLRKGFCAPNPSVGAVIVRNGKILATGYHLGAGYAHAEVDALAKIDYQAQDATMYVTLEPCCHYGKTLPCTNALIKAGIKHVVYGFEDPYPLVAGKGNEILNNANIVCEHMPHPEINSFYQSYAHWLKTGLPFITAKIAVSLDGKIAGIEGKPIQITGKQLQELTHYYRKNADGILTTSKTIITDNPKLNARTQKEVIAKPVFILDSQLIIPKSSTIFTSAKSIILFHSKSASKIRLQELTDLGARCIVVNEHLGGLDLTQIITLIGQEGIHDLWVEAGRKCFSAFIENNLLQRALIYIAPRILGNQNMGLSAAWDFYDCQINWHQYGNDAVCDIRWP